MFESLISFGLTRRPLALLLLVAFIVAGAFAFAKLNIEAYPNPAPVILEITAESPGLSAEEMERLYTIPIEVARRRPQALTTSAPHHFMGCPLFA